MIRFGALGCVALALLLPAPLRADSFDLYFNPVLKKAPTAPGVEKITKLTPEVMVRNRSVLPGVAGTFVVVKTNEGRFAKLLLQPAGQKISETESLPILLIDRFTTFREGEERAAVATGQNVRLFDDFRFSLDIGQIVPTKLGGDLRFVVKGDDSHVEPVGKAEMYLVTKHLAEATPTKNPKLVVGEKFEMRYFNGVYKLFDDGRRTGELHLIVADDGDVGGHFFSDKDGVKYEVAGKAGGNPAYGIQFRVIFPRTFQSYNGLMFTGDGRAIAGTSRLQERETGFYAVRVEDKK